MMMNMMIVLFACVCLLTGCGNTGSTSKNQNALPPQTKTKTEYKKISAEEAHTMMKERADYILLDVRTDEEFKEKRIDGAVLIPDYEIGTQAGQKLTDKNAVILVYCRTGRRSANAAMELISMGYTNVYDFGGIIDWNYDTISN